MSFCHVTKMSIKGGGGVVRELEVPKYRRFFPKIPLYRKIFAKYRYRNTFPYFIVSLLRLAWSTPTKSYQNK